MTATASINNVLKVQRSIVRATRDADRCLPALRLSGRGFLSILDRAWARSERCEPEERPRRPESLACSLGGTRFLVANLPDPRSANTWSRSPWQNQLHRSISNEVQYKARFL